MVAEYSIKFNDGEKRVLILRNIKGKEKGVAILTEGPKVVSAIKGMWLGTTNAVPSEISEAKISCTHGDIISRGNFKKSNNALNLEDFCFVDLGYDYLNLNVFYEQESAKTKLNGFYLAGVDITYEMLLKLGMLKPKINNILKTAYLDGVIGKELKQGEKQFGLYHRETGESLNITSDAMKGFDYAVFRTLLSILLYNKKINIVFINASGLKADEREYLENIVDVLMSLSDSVLVHLYNCDGVIDVKNKTKLNIENLEMKTFKILK